MAVWDIKERYKKARANEIRGDLCVTYGGATDTSGTGTTGSGVIQISSTGNEVSF